MTDVLSPEQRRKNMAHIRGRDTTPERILRSLLFREGYRFRLCDRKLPGCPDIVLKRYRAVIFVHGCFWHRHPGCRYATEPKTHADFWQAKFTANRMRDARITGQLLEMNWNVIIIWECQLRILQKEGITALQNILSRCAASEEACVYEISGISQGE